MWTLDKINTAPHRLGRNHGYKPKDAHSDRGVANQNNKNPNWWIAIKLEWARAALEELFVHHQQRKIHTNIDELWEDDSSQAHLLDQKFFDSPELYQWFWIYTSESKEQDPKLYRSLCEQYHHLMVENNKDPRNGSLIIRSVDELTASEDIVMIVYQDQLIWAIRLQKQDWRLWYLYQRWWLLVHPDFRGDIAWARLWNFLIKETLQNLPLK